MFEGIESLNEIARGYWELGYLDFEDTREPSASLHGDEVVGCRSESEEFNYVPLRQRRRYFSEENKALMRAFVGALRVRYPYPNRAKFVRDTSFEVAVGRVLDTRECLPFDASDTDWELEGDGACA